MTTRTRYFLIASLLVIVVGVGTGLVAYYVGFQPSAFSRQGGPDELQYVPRDASLVAYANVQEVMTSELRQKVRQAVQLKGDRQQEFENETGINIETDIDHVVAFVAPLREADGNLPVSGVVLARGTFNEVKIEALMREHGAHVEDYKGTRLIVADAALQKETGNRAAAAPRESFTLSFFEPGLVALGGSPLIRSAVDLKSGGESVTTNKEMMDLVRSLDSGNVWAVGRFDALRSQAKLPAGVANQLPPITWFSASGQVNGGIRGVLRAETQDEESANNLRDVIRGFISLAKLQTTSKPEMQALVRSLELGGTGKTVALSFSVPAELFDLLGAGIQKQPGR